MNKYRLQRKDIGEPSPTSMEATEKWRKQEITKKKNRKQKLFRGRKNKSGGAKTTGAGNGGKEASYVATSGGIDQRHGNTRKYTEIRPTRRKYVHGNTSNLEEIRPTRRKV